MMKLAVQLYSVRDHIKCGDDLLNILPKIKELGFEGVEFAGYFGVEADVLKAKLDECGLVAVGTHMGLQDYLPVNINKTAEYVKTLGLMYAGVGGAPHGTCAESTKTAKILGKAAEKLGIPTYYHNHTEEFKVFRNGKTAMQVMAEYCKLELDTYWSFCAGVDNYDYIMKNKEDIVLLHIKDGIDRKPMALGEGNNDLAAVIKAAKDAGIEWIVLENDDPVPDGLSDIGRSMQWLKANI